MDERQDLPLTLYQVLEAEYVSLHGRLEEDDVVRLRDRSATKGYRPVRARRDWLFSRGHVKNPVSSRGSKAIARWGP